MTAIRYVGARMQEASSYAGVAAILLGAMHVANPSGVAQAAVGVAVSIGGLIAVLTKERP